MAGEDCVPMCASLPWTASFAVQRNAWHPPEAHYLETHFISFRIITVWKAPTNQKKILLWNIQLNLVIYHAKEMSLSGEQVPQLKYHSITERDQGNTELIIRKIKAEGDGVGWEEGVSRELGKITDKTNRELKHSKDTHQLLSYRKL